MCTNQHMKSSTQHRLNCIELFDVSHPEKGGTQAPLYPCLSSRKNKHREGIKYTPGSLHGFFFSSWSPILINGFSLKQYLQLGQLHNYFGYFAQYKQRGCSQ